MNGKYTPGPWIAARLDEKDMSQWITDHASHPIDLGVAKVYGDDLDNIQANARLIAAAPDLLKSLKELLPMWESGIEEPWVKRARRAIAKAEGGE